MMLMYSLLAFLTIISFMYTWKKKISGKTLVPPGPPGLPSIGNLHQFTKATKIHVYLWKLSTKYGPLMHLKLGSTPVIVVSSARLAREVLKTHDSSFCGRPKHFGLQKLSYGYREVGCTPYGDYWKEARKIMVFHLLSPRNGNASLFCLARQDEVFRMVQRIREFACSKQIVNLSKVAMAYTSSFTCRIAFGRRYGEGVDELLHEINAMMGGFFLSDYLPALSWVDYYITGMVGRLEATCRKLDAFFDELIQEHLDPKREEKIDDILDMLIQLRENNSCRIDLNWDSIKAMLMIIFDAGSITISATIEWTMTALMKTPIVMKKVQEEVRQLVSPKCHVSEDDLQKLPYLKAVIREALRLTLQPR